LLPAWLLEQSAPDTVTDMDLGTVTTMGAFGTG
jgi:hypothetical protein